MDREDNSNRALLTLFVPAGEKMATWEIRDVVMAALSVATATCCRERAEMLKRSYANALDMLPEVIGGYPHGFAVYSSPSCAFVVSGTAASPHRARMLSISNKYEAH